MVLPLGSYIVILRSALGCTVVPVCLPRLHPWHQSVDLTLAEKVHPGFAPIPAGRFMAGGDPRAASPDPLHWSEVPHSYGMQERPVSKGEYCTFLNSLIQQGVLWHQVMAHLPQWGGEVARWHTWRSWWKLRKGRVALPPGVDADEAVSGITWYSAHAYAEWLSATTGAHFRLPTWFEWLKAMCGADSRLFASGNDCTATPTHEESPYGVQPSTVMCWVEEGVEGNPHQEVVAGGCAQQARGLNSPRGHRIAHRASRGNVVGFRLVQVL